MKTISILMACGTLLAGAAMAEPPILARSEPANGGTNVPTNVGVLRFYFDQNMDPTDWTFCASDRGRFPPPAVPKSNPWRDSRCANSHDRKVVTLCR